MPSTPYAKLLVRVNGGAPQSGHIVVNPGDTIQVLIESSEHVHSYRYEIFEYPDGFGVPAGWSSGNGFTHGDTDVYFNTLASPPTFDMPSAPVGALWGKYFLGLVVNNKVPGNQQVDPSQLVDRTTVLEIASSSGLWDTGFREEKQRHGRRGATEAAKHNWRILDGLTAGSLLLQVSKNGTNVGQRPEINLIEGANTTLTVADNAGNNRIDITVAANAASSLTLRREGVLVGNRPAINFHEGAGLALTMTDDGVNGEVDVTYALAAHVTNHQDGGSDELNVTNLTGELADAQKVRVSKAGVLVGTRREINLIEGANTTLTVADNAGSNRVDITVNATASGGPHADTHEDGGSDQINITNLSGEAADAQKVRVSKAGVLVGTRREINLIEGANTTLTVADNSGSNRVDITVAAASSPGLPAADYHGQPLIADAGLNFIPADSTTNFMKIVVSGLSADRGVEVEGDALAAPWFRTTLNEATLTPGATRFGVQVAYYTPDNFSSLFSVGETRFYHGANATDKTVRWAARLAESTGGAGINALDVGRDVGYYLSVAQAAGIRGFAATRPVDDALASELIVYDRRSSAVLADGEVLGRLSCWESTDSGATSWRVGAWEFYHHETGEGPADIYASLRLRDEEGNNDRNALRITANGGIESRRFGEAPTNDDPPIGTLLGYFSVTGVDTVRGEVRNGFQVKADQSWGVGNDNVATLQTLIDNFVVQNSIRTLKNITSSTPVVIKSIAVPVNGSLFLNWYLRARLQSDQNSVVNIGGSLLVTRDGSADPVIIESAFFPSYVEKGAYNPVPNDETNFTPQINTGTASIEFMASSKSDASTAVVNLDVSWN